MKKYEEAWVTGENRSGSPLENGRRWQFAWCEFIELSRQLLVHGLPVKLEAKPADVLVLLLERPTEVLTKDELIGAGWSNTAEGASDNSLTTAIRKLRAAFGGGRDGIILTVPNVGYRMAVPVVEKTVDSPPPPGFHLAAGDPIPRRPHWRAQRPLDATEPATVWLAEHTKTHEVRVFKFAEDGVRLRALQRELTLSRLLQRSLADASAFVRVMDWDLEESPYFTESEYGGINLLEWADTEDFQQLLVPERITLAADLAEAVATAHSLGVLHNDIKPTNVLVLKVANGESVGGESAGVSRWGIKVADFGVASLTQPERLRQMEITQHGFAEGEQPGGTPVGTGMYRAPETLAGAPATTLADVYALGVMLYQIVCGDFLEPPMPGWESRISDPLLREEIAATAHRDPRLRTATADEVAQRLRSIEARRTDLQRLEAENREREGREAQAEGDRRSLERARMLRPWIVLTMVALVAGISVSVWFAHRTSQALKLAERQTSNLASMNNFLIRDLLEQSNPLGRSGTPQQITLIDAVERVLPQIDGRFVDSPEIAGRLHEAIAGSLDARTDYTQAADEFEKAAELYRKAQGELSTQAIIAELRRENTQLRSGRADLIAEANIGFKKQSALISKLPSLPPEVECWQAFIFSAIGMHGSDPAQAISVLQKAAERGDAIPGFNPSLLMNLKLRLAPIYMSMDDGADAERVSRQAIETVRRVDGPATGAMLQAQIFLQEALYMEGKYDEALTQGKLNGEAFSSALGLRNQLTIASLMNTAQTEGALEKYSEAIRDEQPLYELERSIPAGQHLALTALDDISRYECRSERFASGMQHGHQLVDDANAASSAAFVNTAKFNMAECMLAQAEQSPPRMRSQPLSEASQLLDSLNVQAVIQTLGEVEFDSLVEIDGARLAYLEGEHQEAKQLLAQVSPQLTKPQFDRFARRNALMLEKELAGDAKAPFAAAFK